MRKTSALFGVAALLLALLIGQTGSGQMPMDTMAQPQAQSDPQALQHEIHLLMAINRMGLTEFQLERLKTILADLKVSQMAQMQRQRELKQFLLSWQGSPEEFDAALKEQQEKLQQGQKIFQQQRRQALEQLKDVFSYRQGELLRETLQKLSGGMPAMGQMQQPMGQSMTQMRGHMGQRQGGSGMGGHGQMGMMGRTQQHMQPMMQHMQQMMQMMQMMQQMGGMGQAPSFDELVLKHLDLLERVLGEKLQALRGQQP
jgi:hypothetical protein